MEIFDHTIKEVLKERLEQLEAYFESDVVFYFGEIHPSLAKGFRDFLEKPLCRKEKPGQIDNLPEYPVSNEEKQQRAEEIAKRLGDNKLWHSHGRMIDVFTLKRVLRLEIEDYSEDMKLRPMIRSYNDLLIEYIRRSNFKIFMHSRNFF